MKWLEISSLTGLLISLILWGAGCRTPAGNNGPLPTAVPTGIACHVFYRNSQAEPPGPESTIKLSRHGDRDAVQFDALEFSAQYHDDQFEGRSLFISVSATDSSRQLTGQLYQMDRQQGVNNQFQGGHGFTGLAYIYHPTVGAELQYFCDVQSSVE